MSNARVVPGRDRHWEVVVSHYLDQPDGSVAVSQTCPDGWVLDASSPIRTRLTGGYWGQEGWVPVRVVVEDEVRLYQLDGRLRGTEAQALAYLAEQGFEVGEAKAYLAGLKPITSENAWLRHPGGRS